LAFLPFEIVNKNSLFMGLAVLGWTIVNGALLNIHYKLKRKQATIAYHKERLDELLCG
jgi:hypothetical protein